MKHWVWIPVLLLLCGCSTPVWETVDDLQPETAVSRQVQLFELQLQLPEQVQLLAADDAGSLWATADSELEIEQRVFLTTDPDSAIRAISGFTKEQLTVLQTTRQGLPEYQFAWVSQTDRGARLYRADLILDGFTCYAVVCSSLEDSGEQYAFQARQVFSSLHLQKQTLV